MTETDAVERRVMGKLDALGKELIELRAENNMLKGVIVARPEVREIVGELRGVLAELADGLPNRARVKLAVLLRRLDRESQ